MKTPHTDSLHNQPYNPSLDSLRGIAVTAVVIGHAGHYFFSQTDNPVPGGFLGVDIFFVLSGYLITGILLRDIKRRGKVDFRRFYINRFLRLIPALLLLLIAYTAAVAVIGRLDELSPANVLAVLFYYFNWYIAHTLDSPEGLGHLWSLSVEEQFYIFWPVLLMLMIARLKSPRWIMLLFVLAIVLVCIARAGLWREGYSWLILYIRTDLRADSLLIGGLLAFAHFRGYLPRVYPQALGMLAALALFAMALLVAREDAFLYLGGLSLISLLSGLLIICALGDAPAFYDCRPLRQLGKISYGVYLWHLPLFTALAAPSAPDFGPYLGATIGIGATLLISSASWYLLEKPCLRYKRHPSGT